MREIKIDPELRTLLDPLFTEELENLEASLLAEGCRDPLVVWKEEGTLIDGHHRYEICTKHGIKFDVRELSFQAKSKAMEWMFVNQLSRRNLTAYSRAKAALKLEEQFKLEAKKRQAIGHLNAPQYKKNPVVPNLAQLEDAEEKIDERKTREKVAKIAGVSHGTLDKVKVIEEEATEEQKQELLQKSNSVHGVWKDVKEEKEQ